MRNLLWNICMNHSTASPSLVVFWKLFFSQSTELVAMRYTQVVCWVTSIGCWSSCDVQSGNALLQIPLAWSTVVPTTSTICSSTPDTIFRHGPVSWVARMDCYWRTTVQPFYSSCLLIVRTHPRRALRLTYSSLLTTVYQSLCPWFCVSIELDTFNMFFDCFLLIFGAIDALGTMHQYTFTFHITLHSEAALRGGVHVGAKAPIGETWPPSGIQEIMSEFWTESSI